MIIIWGFEQQALVHKNVTMRKLLKSDDYK